jgi:flagellar protein FlaF
MNPSNLDAYQQAQKLAITPSAAESATLVKAAGILEKAKETITDMATYSAALKFNQRFWTVLQADLTSPGNKLSDKIKGDLLSLIIFIDKQTIKALADPKAEHLDVLIEINRNIAMGLRKQQTG